MAFVYSKQTQLWRGIGFGGRLFCGPEPRVRLQGNQGQDFEHSRLKDREAIEGGAHLGLTGGFPQDGSAGQVASTPHLAEDSGGVKFLHPLALAASQFRGESFGWESVSAAAGEGKELHEQIVEEKASGQTFLTPDLYLSKNSPCPPFAHGL